MSAKNMLVSCRIPGSIRACGQGMNLLAQWRPIAPILTRVGAPLDSWLRPGSYVHKLYPRSRVRAPPGANFLRRVACGEGETGSWGSEQSHTWWVNFNPDIFHCHIIHLNIKPTSSHPGTPSQAPSPRRAPRRSPLASPYSCRRATVPARSATSRPCTCMGTRT